jgi:hypothetical protein
MNLELKQMSRRSTSFAFALSLLLLVPFADCLAMSADQQSMKCCKTMPCDPANRAHDCCKKMVSPQVASVLPNVHVSFDVSPVVTAELLTVPEIGDALAWLGTPIETPQHAPPPLYILYAHLLI